MESLNLSHFAINEQSPRQINYCVTESEFFETKEKVLNDGILSFDEGELMLALFLFWADEDDRIDHLLKHTQLLGHFSSHAEAMLKDFAVSRLNMRTVK